jgi:acyl carrier protein
MSAEKIVEIFRRVLNNTEVRTNSDFFEMGGDSLLATRVLSAVARDFGAELMYDEFAQNPSPAALFAKVAATVP